MHHNRHDRGGGKPNMRRKVVSWARNLHVGLDTPLYESPNRGLSKAVLAEFFFMSLFVFVGTGSVVFGCHFTTTGEAFGGATTGAAATCPSTYGGGRITTIAFAFGMSIFVMVFSAASFSGGHLNPAVTLAFLITKKICLMRAVLYWVAQILGSILGSACVYAVDRSGWYASGGAVNSVIPGVSNISALLMEAILTGILIFTVFAATDGMRARITSHLPILAPLAIGFAVFVAHLVAIPIDGCSINPARSLGPAIVANSFKGQWVFWLGPMFGAAFAAILYELAFRPGTLEEIMEEDEDSDSDEEPLKGGDVEAGSTASKTHTKHKKQFMSMPVYAGVAGNKQKKHQKKMKVVMVPEGAPLPSGALDAHSGEAAHESPEGQDRARCNGQGAGGNADSAPGHPERSPSNVVHITH